MNILSLYEIASGQAVNLQKSKIYFNKNTSQQDRDSIANMMGVAVTLGTGKYLGLPSMVGWNKKARVKSVPLAIPTYCIISLVPLSVRSSSLPFSNLTFYSSLSHHRIGYGSTQSLRRINSMSTTISKIRSPQSRKCCQKKSPCFYFPISPREPSGKSSADPIYKSSFIFCSPYEFMKVKKFVKVFMQQ